MLDSVKISRRQSEIRQEIAALTKLDKPSEDEVRSMEDLSTEYETNEKRYRAALVAEDTERREAGEELETRESKEWAETISNYEVRQVALALAEDGRALDGATAEIVSEMRSKGSYQGIPVPYAALAPQGMDLEKRTTIASGVIDPVRTMPIVDRIFAQSAATRMGATMINIDSGEVEYPVVSSSITAGWQATETGDVAGPTAFETTDKPLVPVSTLGITMTLTRRTLKQGGSAVEQAVRRDMTGTIGQELDKAMFLGSGGSGEPLGVVEGASTYGVTETAIGANATWAAFRGAVRRFMDANAISSPDQVRLLIRPSVWEELDETVFDAGSGMTEWDRLVKNLGAANVVTSANALAAATGSPLASKAFLTCAPGGVPPMFIGMWGGIDMIRDPYTSAPSGALKLTGLVTADVTVGRPAQLEVLTGVQED
ncbi:MAG: phage major capsid protein [Paracoccaceae bacterium]|nr:phage major capsid protein [Paracoccaceae bacterium]